MTKQRRTFSAEFKREAAGLVLDQGYSHIEASRSLGVVESALRRWVSQLQQERNGVTPQSKALTPEQQKIQELEARIARLEREKSVLKKDTSFLLLRPLLATSGSPPSGFVYGTVQAKSKRCRQLQYRVIKRPNAL